MLLSVGTPVAHTRPYVGAHYAIESGVLLTTGDGAKTEGGISVAGVLVTGGAGFIGSHVVEGLIACGAQVSVLDNLSTGRRENLPHHERVRFIEGDIRDPAKVDSLVRGVDAIVHLAAVASVPASIADPAGTHETNFTGTLNLLEAARRHGGKRFVYASSAAVYGDRIAPPVTETGAPDPLSPYAADKLAGEHYLGFYAREFGLSAISFRFFNIYGPRQDPSSPYSGVISIFADRARRGEAVTIYGDGQQTRDFVYVSDLATLLVDTTLSDRPLTAQTINVGRGIECTLLDLLGAMEHATGRSIGRRFADARSGDIRRSCAGTERLKAFSGGVPQTPIDVGLTELLAYLAR